MTKSCDQVRTYHNFLFSFSTVIPQKFNLHFWKKMRSFFFFFVLIPSLQPSLLVFDNIIFSSDFLLFLFPFHSKALRSFGRNERTCWKDIKNTAREFVQMVHYKIFLLLCYLRIYNLIILLQIFRISSFKFLPLEGFSFIINVMIDFNYFFQLKSVIFFIFQVRRSWWKHEIRSITFVWSEQSSTHFTSILSLIANLILSFMFPPFL